MLVLTLAACDRGSAPELAELRARLDTQEQRITVLEEQLKRLTDDLEAERSTGLRNAMAALSSLPGLEPQKVPGNSGVVPITGPDLSDLAPITCEEGRCTIPRGTFDALRADPGGLVKQARIIPRMQEGAMHGLKLYGIRPTSVFRAIGMENGDTVTELGGKQLRSMEDAMTAYTALLERREWSIKGERRGLPFEVTIVIEK